MSTETQPWADSPFSLIPTPGRGQDISKLHSSLYIARDMACAHNGILRGLNSIYQQCIHVTSPSDVADLLKYTEFWCGWINEHHDYEEEFFFPDIERISGVEGLMSANVRQHEAFMGGLMELSGFAKKGVEGYSGVEMRGIIDRFGDTLTLHLREEIGTLLALKDYDSAALLKAYNVFEGKLRSGDKAVLFPIVMGTHDTSYEEGFTWPEVPGFVRPLVHHWFERKHRGVWRFNPSDTWGKRRELEFLGAKK